MTWNRIEFAHSTTRHKIDDRRSQFVVEHAIGTYPVPASIDHLWTPERLLFIGDDKHGVPLEVIGIELDDGDLMIIDAQKLRPNYKKLYEQVMRDNRI
jgi:hypothetical protein